MIPVLFTTYNRLEFTKRSLEALLNSEGVDVIIVDNGSVDGTLEYLHSLKESFGLLMMAENEGIAGAMNRFLEMTKNDLIVGKVDNDTVVPKNWAVKLQEKLLKCNVDAIQAKHPLLNATFPGANFDQWMRTKRRDEKDDSVFHSNFVGGSGLILRRDKINFIPATNWKLYGWRQYQREHPSLKTAFCTAVEIELLDMNKNGGTNYPEEYLSYYKETGRIQ
jgi:GT2 family glycosyltransferase